MIDTIEFKGHVYPYFQPQPASHFIIPIAKKVCMGEGYDIGCGPKVDKFPGAIGIDKSWDDEWHAMNLPVEKVDYIFSSHCLEHVDNWVLALDHWTSRLHNRGTLFLYLPDYSQVYWRPWNNTKHKHIMNKTAIVDYLIANGYKRIFSSGVDLNNSFAVMAEKGES